MTDEQSQLLALPPGYHDPQQSKQISQKLAVDLDLLPGNAAVVVAHATSPRSPPQLRLALRSGLLLRDGIADTLYQGKKQGQVDSAGDAGAVLEIKAGQAGGDLPDRALGREQFGLRSHGVRGPRRGGAQLNDAPAQRESGGGISQSWRKHRLLSKTSAGYCEYHIVGDEALACECGWADQRAENGAAAPAGPPQPRMAG